MTFSVAPLGPGDLDRVAHISVAPDQIEFVGTVQEAFKADKPDVDFHTILQDTDPVGFFKIDRAYPVAHPFAPKGSLGLRAFLVDRTWKGRGIATRAIRLMPL